MAKPIFTIGIPIKYAPSKHEGLESIRRIQNELYGKYDDYHVLIYPSLLEEPTFKAFYDKDLIPVQFEELKKIVEKTMDDFKNASKEADS